MCIYIYAHISDRSSMFFYSPMQMDQGSGDRWDLDSRAQAQDRAHRKGANLAAKLSPDANEACKAAPLALGQVRLNALHLGFALNLDIQAIIELLLEGVAL